MRVQRPEADVYLALGGLRRVKNPFVRPSEMLDITLSVEQLSKLEGDTLRVRIVSGKEAGVDAYAHTMHRLSLELRSGYGNRRIRRNPIPHRQQMRPVYTLCHLGTHRP